jgi:hypothetical protein
MIQPMDPEGIAVILTVILEIAKQGNFGLRVYFEHSCHRYE